MSLEQLMQFTVIGASKYEQKQSEVAAAASVITRDEIKTYGWRTLAEALNSLPGIHLTYDRQYTYVGTRGFGLPGDYVTRVLLTINGNRVNDVVYDGALFGHEFLLDMDVIERIEFIPGPGGAVYGQNALFGVVNVITRSGPSLDGAELSVAQQRPQSTTQGSALWGKALDNGTEVLLSVAGLHARGEDRFFDFGTSGVSGMANGMDGERAKKFFTRVTHGRWAFDLAYSDRRKDDPTGSYFSDPLAPGAYQRDRYWLSQLQYEDKLAGDTLQVTARLFAESYRYTALGIYGGIPFASSASSEQRGAEVRLLSSAVAGHKLLLGMEYQDNARQDQTFEDTTNPDNRVFVPRSGYRAGVYVQDEWSIARTLAATLGLRVDRNNTNGTKISPRAALIWQASASTTVKTLYGRAYRAPNAFERDYADAYTQVANPGLRGEQIDTLELVVDQRVRRDLNVRGSVYQWTIKDLITLGVDPDSGLTQYQSGAKVKAHGVELSAEKTWQPGGRVRGSVSLQDVVAASGTRLVNSPQLLARLNASTPLPVAGARLGYEFQYDGRRRTVDGTDVGGYAVSNVNLVAERLARNLDVSLGIYNLLDKRYAHPAADINWQNALEQDGRSVRIKLTYAF